MLDSLQLNYIGDSINSAKATMNFFIVMGFPFIDFVYLGINIFIIMLLNSIKNKLTNK